MKKIKLTLITILLALVTPAFVSCEKANIDTSGCYLDIDEAKKAASKKGQDMLVFITMNGDDADSQPFTDNVIRNSKFKSEIASKYIAARLDFSQSSYEATVAAEGANDTAKKNAEKRADMMQRNTKFANLLNVTVTPSVYIISKEGYMITSLYYDAPEKSYEGFKAFFDEKSAAIDEMHKMIYQTKIGTAEEKVQAIDALYEATAPTARHFLADLLASTKKLDSTNKSGLVGKLLYASVEAQTIFANNSGDIKSAVDAYLSIENEELIDAHDRQKALYTAAYLCAMTGLEEAPKVIEYLERAIALQPDSEEVPAIQNVIKSLSAN